MMAGNPNQPVDGRRSGRCFRWALRGFAGVVALAMGVAACTPTAFINNFSSLGGDTPGGRDSIRIAFMNDTPFRAIFTFGTYDPLNQGFTPRFNQFTTNADRTRRLEGNSQSQDFTFVCGRMVSIGGKQLIDRIVEGQLDRDEAVDQNALKPGIAFSDKPLDDPQAGEATAGTDEGIETLQGVEYECGSLLVYTLVQDAAQPDGFRVDLSITRP